MCSPIVTYFPVLWEGWLRIPFALLHGRVAGWQLGSLTFGEWLGDWVGCAVAAAYCNLFALFLRLLWPGGDTPSLHFLVWFLSLDLD